MSMSIARFPPCNTQPCVGSRCAVLQDFMEVVKRPQLVALGATLQYTLMPLMGFLVTRLFQLPVAYSVG